MSRLRARMLRSLEDKHDGADLERLERLLVANQAGMSRLLADVERQNGPEKKRVVVLKADFSPPSIYVHSHEEVREVLLRGGRVFEAEELDQDPGPDAFHVLVGTENVLRVRVVQRGRATSAGPHATAAVRRAGA
jgi:hypothetical protein